MNVVYYRCQRDIKIKDKSQHQYPYSNFLCMHEHFDFVHEKNVAIGTTYCFVDIGGIVDQYCLNFLLIIQHISYGFIFISALHIKIKMTFTL